MDFIHPPPSLPPKRILAPQWITPPPPPVEIYPPEEGWGENNAPSPLHLELVPLDDALFDVLLDFPDDRQHGDVCFSGTGWSRDQQVLVGVVRRVEHDRLDAVQLFHSFESDLIDLEIDISINGSIDQVLSNRTILKETINELSINKSINKSITQSVT